MIKKDSLPSLYSILAFIAGFSFLVFEVSWFRMLALILGATVSASTLILSVFMAGIGAGAFYWGNRALNTSKASKTLVLIFAAIGLVGLISPFILNTLMPKLAQSFSPFITVLLCIIFLFIPAFFMGGLLPLLSRIMVQKTEQIAHDLGSMYAYETFGSTLGGLFAGFLLIGSIGQNNTIFVASIINLVLAGIFLFKKPIVSSNENSGQNAPYNPKKADFKQEKTMSVDKSMPLIIAFITGFVVVGLQIIWIRVFKVYMTNTSYTFALVASMVILGLFVGSRLYVWASHKKISIIKFLSFLALSIIGSYTLMLNLHTIVFFPFTSWQEIHWIRIFLIPFISSLLVILPVTILSGFAFPYACTLYSSDVKTINRSVGHILLLNTAGSVAGPLFAAFILIPVLGSALSVLALLLLIVLTTLYFLFRQKSTNPNHLMIAVVGLAAISLLAILVIKPKIHILPPSFTKHSRQILAYNESVEGTFVVGKESEANNSALSTYVNNSAVIGSSYDAIKAVKMVGHIPFFTGLQCKKALVVGFGIGVTTSAIASHSEVETIDCVELVSGLKKTAHFYSGLNHNIANDNRLNIISGDGRYFLQNNHVKYDLISSDPTHPILGSGSLYTREYFELCKQHLTPGGMVSQYLPIHKLMLTDLLGIIKTFNSVFPEATVWIGHYHLILIGSNKPIKIDFETWKRNIASSEKDPYFYTNPYHVAACLLLDKTDISRFPADIKINTDNRSYVEFFNLDAFDQENIFTNLQYLNSIRGTTNNVFFNIDDTSSMGQFREGNIELTLGLIQMLKNNNKGLLYHLQNATRKNPENEELPFLIKFYFN